MSQVAPMMRREPVELDKRQGMHDARKARIWEAWGRCCWFCRMPVEVSGPTVVYDHVGTLWITGSDADKDIGPIHAKPCNKIKTAADLTKIAKTKRLIKKNSPDETKEPSRLQGRGFDKTKTRGFDGKIKPRASVSAKGGQPKAGANYSNGSEQ